MGPRLECGLGSRLGPTPLECGLGPRLERGLGPTPLECGLGPRLGSRLGAPPPFICRLGSPLGLGSPLEWWWLLGLAVLTPVRQS